MLAYEKHVAGASCFSKPFYFIGERAQTTENFFGCGSKRHNPLPLNITNF